MSSNTKIFIFKAKELIYTLLFVLFGITLLLLLIFFFLPKNNTDEQLAPTMKYNAGIYTSTMNLGGKSLDLKVVVDRQKIKSISIPDMDASIETLYPLLKPTIDDINRQLETIDSIDELTFQNESQYTNTILRQAMKNAMKKANSAE